MSTLYDKMCNPHYPDCDYEEPRPVKILALDDVAPLMADTLRLAVDDWPQFDADEDVNGADLVQWFADYRERVRAVLAQWGEA